MFFVKPSGTRPWPVSPDDFYRMLLRLVSSRVGSRRLELQSHGTLTALRPYLIGGAKSPTWRASEPLMLPGPNSTQAIVRNGLATRDHARATWFATSTRIITRTPRPNHGAPGVEPLRCHLHRARSNAVERWFRREIGNLRAEGRRCDVDRERSNASVKRLYRVAM